MPGHFGEKRLTAHFFLQIEEELGEDYVSDDGPVLRSIAEITTDEVGVDVKGRVGVVAAVDVIAEEFREVVYVDVSTALTVH
mmetsp:Transcript_12140/g.15136  ORF Transcript_12140/g.15136 Transcript_12140/m.15136 type:complete len:82 (+) Transcript_12140:1356-1601(+)